MNTLKGRLISLLISVTLILFQPSWADSFEDAMPLSSVRYEETAFAKVIDQAIQRYFPEYQDPHFTPTSDFLTKDNLFMLALNIGSYWRYSAMFLGYSMDDQRKIHEQAVQNALISKNAPDIQELISEGKLALYDDEATIEQILIFLSDAQKKYSIERIAESMGEIYPTLPNAILSHQKKKPDSGKTNSEASVYSSYIFTMWLKHPTRSANWGHIVPNTVFMPHQQTLYDWARLNPDKLVVLWYDSAELTRGEIQQFKALHAQMSLYVDNVRFLDVRNVSWSPIKLSYSKQKLGLLTPGEAFEKVPFFNLGDKVDFLRTRLLYEGSGAIHSAMNSSAFDEVSQSLLPQMGIYFDLDYIPRTFDAQLLIRNELCIDDFDDTLSKTLANEETEFNGSFYISLLAVRENHSRLLGPELRINSVNRYLIPYGDTVRTAKMSRYNLCGIRGFKMTANPYSNKQKDSDKRAAARSWAEDYKHEIDQLSNNPLNTW
ncbi:MAG: hypothetical protein ACR2PT_16320 [Endozoicomonas sp.]